MTCIPRALIQKLAARQSSEAPTNRELEVLELLARGRSSKKIGATLFIGKTTGKSYLRNICGKLNVRAHWAASRRSLVQL